MNDGTRNYLCVFVLVRLKAEQQQGLNPLLLVKDGWMEEEDGQGWFRDRDGYEMSSSRV